MGSLRNPVGPLPSTIYWRRRAVLLSMAALLALLVTWIVTSGGGGGGDNAGDANGKNTAPSTITPGPSESGPAISEHPGGREESGTGGGSGDSSGADTGGSGGSGATAGSGDSSGTGSDDGADGAGGGSGSGDRVPAGSSLPNCTTSSVKLTLRSVRNSYAPGAKPKFELIAENSSGTACKLDLGPRQAVLTITQSGDDKQIWSSKDCPSGSGSLLLRVPGDGRVTHTVEWDRKQSAPNCATPPATPAGAGTYLVEASTPGMPVARTSFVLTQD
ncbi:hypothetical protein ACIQNU_14265 [Streptomyces sp. NPDC091292]|uniref:hypothetical protein n=1 Tax=Streptomyces sp. NPDC091292 TaxID=3365991 RepID=UPI0037F30A8E